MIDERPWNDPGLEVPASIDAVPAMLAPAEKRMLYWLAREWWKGEGVIVELGAYLGGSSVCLLSGLRDRGETRRIVHVYDRWVLGPFERRRDFQHGAPPYDNVYHLWEHNIRGLAELAFAHPGDIIEQRWNGDPIEILFVDLAKTSETWDHVVREFFPALLPGAIVVLQDYLFAQAGPWHHVVMEKLTDHFEYVADTDINSVLFRHTRPIHDLDGAMWVAIPPDEKVELMERAIAMFPPEKQEILRGPQEMLLEISSRTAGCNATGT